MYFDNDITALQYPLGRQISSEAGGALLDDAGGLYYSGHFRNGSDIRIAEDLSHGTEGKLFRPGKCEKSSADGKCQFFNRCHERGAVRCLSYQSHWRCNTGIYHCRTVQQGVGVCV